MTLAYVLSVYRGSDGDATKALYARLEELGPVGVIGVNLFRAQKASERAKVYRGGERGRGSYKSMAYDRKAWAIDNLCGALGRHADGLGIVWGWGLDPAQPVHRDVLYVDLSTGQVSFHTAPRGAGPDYSKAWDGARGVAADRVVRWVAGLLDRECNAMPGAR